MLGPILRGEKCTLRPPVKEEFSVMAKWFEDPEVIRYTLQFGPPSEGLLEERFKQQVENSDNVAWAVEVDGRPVGHTGIWGINWRYSHGETGIVIGEKSLWRKGVASEAMALRTRFGFEELHLHKIKTRAFVENEASIRALKKAGYRECGIQRKEVFRDGRWHDIWMGEVLREDWEREHRERAR